MAVKLKKAVITAIFFIGLSSQGAQAKSAACDRLAGSTIFTDMLYGLAGGAILSGLYIAASDNSEHSSNKVAYGALGGSVLGIGVGLAEVFTAKCAPQAAPQPGAATKRPTFNLFAAPKGSSTAAGLNFTLPI